MLNIKITKDKIQSKIGKVFTSKNGDSQCVCIDYRTSHDCDIMFLDCGYIKQHVNWHNLQKGSFKSPYTTSVAGVGFIGIGESRENHIDAYGMWARMMERCYNTRIDRRRDINYADCFVAYDWHNFQNFLSWYDDNLSMYKANEPMTLDKDLLYKGNRIYSQHTCLLIPERINIFLTTSKFARGEYPIGVFFESDCGKFKAQCCDPFERYGRNIGRFTNSEDAFYRYKEVKEKYAKDLANYYDGKIDQRAIDALRRFSVDITD